MIFIMAIRNIFRNKRRSLLTFGMMIFGFVLFSLFVTMSEGGYDRFIEKFIQEKTGHVQIHSKGYLETPKFFNSIDGPNEIFEILERKEGIKAYAPRFFSGALAFHSNKSLGVEIVGIDALLESNVTTLKKRVTQGKFFTEDSQYEDVVIGQSIAEVLKIKLGDEFILVSQGGDGSIANDLFRARGIIKQKMKGIDDYRVYMSLENAQKFLSFPNKIHEIALVLDNNHPPRKFALSLTDDFKKTFPDLHISPWQEVEKDFYKAMEADKKGDNIARFIFIIVMAIGVFNTVLMSTLERTREFGVLKAIGTRPINIVFLIFIENVIMAIGSICIGSVLALVVDSYFSYYGISLATPIEWGGIQINEVRGKILTQSFYDPALIVLTTTLLVCLYPAFKAMRISPTDAMRSI